MDNYRRYRNTLTKIIREAKKICTYNELQMANPKKTWNILKELTTGPPKDSTVSDVFKTGKGLVSDESEIAQGFNTFFTDVGKQLKSKLEHTETNPLKIMPEFAGRSLEVLQDTCVNEVKQIVNDMRVVGGGHDKINTRIFKSTFTSIQDEITHLMNICLQQGTFPCILKKAVIKPMYKAGDKQLFNNYRPISLLPVVSKLLERLIYKRLDNHLVINNILSEFQFGFRESMGTHMPILLLQDKIQSAFEANKNVVGIYLDLRKAFDTVNLDILLGKLQCYGVIRQAHNMIKLYLTNRTQCVQIGDVRSSFLPIEMGVPQGSILGPLLFILYINDFPLICEQMTSYLYADDTAIFVEGENEHELNNALTTLLPKMSEWFTSNQLSLNTDKTFYQIYTNKRTQLEVEIKPAGADITRVKVIKYLRMFIDEDMKWKTHIAKLHTVLCRNVGIINRVKYFLKSKHLLLLYNSLFLSHVNYCCFLYSNTYSSHLTKIEKLQKRVLRIVDEQPRLAHSAPIFKKLGLLRLRDIGKHQMVLLMHRKLKMNLPSLVDKLFVLAHPSRVSRAKVHFEQPFAGRVHKTQTISWAGPRLWNKVMGPIFPTASMVPLEIQH